MIDDEDYSRALTFHRGSVSPLSAAQHLVSRLTLSPAIWDSYAHRNLTLRMPDLARRNWITFNALTQKGLEKRLDDLIKNERKAFDVLRLKLDQWEAVVVETAQVISGHETEPEVFEEGRKEILDCMCDDLKSLADDICELRYTQNEDRILNYKNRRARLGKHARVKNVLEEIDTVRNDAVEFTAVNIDEILFALQRGYDAALIEVAHRAWEQGYLRGEFNEAFRAESMYVYQIRRALFNEYSVFGP